ncbi:protein GPR15LG [Trichechus inunguis]|uniref:Protein GPR15LG n=1 Tax=Trichechus manatus latirostris TaxID=127582 RepID=A0A2Y9G1M8_TRIMA|nr:protein GPR15LG [Trichechus manatus latirostris]
MRLSILTSVLCILLLCFSIFLAEGRRHHAKPRRGRPCCPRGTGLVLRGHHVRPCRPCKLRTGLPNWVVPGALPQV